VAALLLTLVGGRAALRSFGTHTVLSDGAKAYASCKAPWRSARIVPPHQRFTLWVMTGGSGERRDEGVASLGARCRTGARVRMAFAAAMVGAAATLTWLALRRGGRETMPA